MGFAGLALQALFVFDAVLAVPGFREPPGSSELLQNANGINDAFAGVALFRGPLTCTGSLIDPSGSGAADARAWLLTAGHCISLELPARTLAGVQVSVMDETGRILPVWLRTAGPLYLERLMPLWLWPGAATVIVQPPEGPPLSQPVKIRRTAPGLFSDNDLAVPKGFAMDRFLSGFIRRLRLKP